MFDRLFLIGRHCCNVDELTQKKTQPTSQYKNMFCWIKCQILISFPMKLDPILFSYSATKWHMLGTFSFCQCGTCSSTFFFPLFHEIIFNLIISSSHDQTSFEQLQYLYRKRIYTMETRRQRSNHNTFLGNSLLSDLTDYKKSALNDHEMK